MHPESGITVPLTLVDHSGRRIDTGPEEVTFGAIRLGRWHVHPLAAPATAFPGSSAHLLKITFDLLVDHGAPFVRWFEVRFTLAEPGSTIVAAAPRGASEAQPARSYAVSRNLEFVATEGTDAVVHIAPTEGPIYAYGASGDHIRWLHVAAEKAGIRPGSYSAWIVLLAPEGHTEEKLRLSARFDPGLTAGDDFGQVTKSAEFSISLVDPALPPVGVIPADGPGVGLPVHSPRIFVCYAHEDETHKKLVRDFADLLRTHGMDPTIDRDHEGPRTEWDHWALREIRAADFIAVIASPICQAIGDGTYHGADRAGMRFELGVIRNLLQRHPDWASHLLPVVLPGHTVDEIPMFLRPETADHYTVEALTRTEIDYLLKTIATTPAWRGWNQP